MPNRYIGVNVFDSSLERIEALYRAGHRVIISFSGGKDSGVCVELAIIAARRTGNLPVQVVMRDEEIMFPGTYEYALRVAERPEIDFHWYYASQPIINAFSREMPYWWTFDPEQESLWVRRPPSIAKYVSEQYLDNMVTVARFPPTNEKINVVVTGIRAGESMNRRMSIYASKGHLTRPRGNKKERVIQSRPIFDWSDSDVWRAISQHKWDYCKSYNTLYRLGLKRNKLRIAPPTMNSAAVEILPFARKAWPTWFDKMCLRIPGIRTATKFGKRAVRPERRLNESWEECYKRVCIEKAPAWLAPRATAYMQRKLEIHSRHASSPFPEVRRCTRCARNGCWRLLARNLYMGDPLGVTDAVLTWHKASEFRTDRVQGARAVVGAI